MIYKSKVTDRLINHLYDVLDQSKKDLFQIPHNSTCTRGGFQTQNAVARVDRQLLLEEMTPLIRSYFQLHYDNALYSYRCDIDHIHIIDYQPGGLQHIHNHARTEDHSFIIYMNDSDGKTRFYVGETPEDVVSNRGSVVLFDAAYYHEGLACSDRRFITVGAIRFREKEWHEPFGTRFRK